MTPARTNQNWLPSIFNEFLDNNWLAERRNATAPAVNIIEDEDEYKVEVAAPGMTREDFKVHINEDNELIISLEKKIRGEGGGQETHKGTYLRREFSYTQFPAEPAAARQRRAREDLGQGRERRDDHRDSRRRKVTEAAGRRPTRSRSK
nr:Hsp20/alpha crystallin family protein [Alistipes onderdonkii]